MTFKRSLALVTMIAKALLICCSLEMATATQKTSHHSPPSEDNVFSPPICKTNQDGFGGNIGTAVLTVEYYYEMELRPEPELRPDPEDPGDLTAITFIMERSIADFLLQTNEFNDIPCDDRRLETVKPPRFRRDQRRLIAVGLTINPPDYPIDRACKNEPAPAPGNECHVVVGELQVYTVGNPSTETGLTQAVTNRLKAAMNRGDFDGAQDSIVKITYLDELTPDTLTGDELNEQTPNQTGRAATGAANTGLIVGASLGSLFLIGALAFYRRRHSKPEGDDEFSQSRGTIA